MIPEQEGNNVRPIDSNSEKVLCIRDLSISAKKTLGQYAESIL